PAPGRSGQIAKPGAFEAPGFPADQAAGPGASRLGQNGGGAAGGFDFLLGGVGEGVGGDFESGRELAAAQNFHAVVDVADEAALEQDLGRDDGDAQVGQLIQVQAGVVL